MLKFLENQLGNFFFTQLLVNFWLPPRSRTTRSPPARHPDTRQPHTPNSPTWSAGLPVFTSCMKCPSSSYHKKKPKPLLPRDILNKYGRPCTRRVARSVFSSMTVKAMTSPPSLMRCTTFCLNTDFSSVSHERAGGKRFCYFKTFNIC